MKKVKVYVIVSNYFNFISDTCNLSDAMSSEEPCLFSNKRRAKYIAKNARKKFTGDRYKNFKAKVICLGKLKVSIMKRIGE